MLEARKAIYDNIERNQSRLTSKRMCGLTKIKKNMSKYKDYTPQNTSRDFFQACVNTKFREDNGELS